MHNTSQEGHMPDDEKKPLIRHKQNLYIVYTDAMKEQINLLAQRLAEQPFPVPGLVNNKTGEANVSQVIEMAILCLHRAIASDSAAPTAALSKRYVKLYLEHRAMPGRGDRARLTDRTVTVNDETRVQVDTIGAWLKQRFAERTIPQLYRGDDLNKKMVVAFCIYYTLDVLTP